MVRTAGSKSFTAAETQLLLDIVEKIRPLGRQRWDAVAAAYNDQISLKDWVARDADALKRRFMVLAYAKKPSEEWREFMDRATSLHDSILQEAGASPNMMGLGGLAGNGEHGGMGHDSDGSMLLLTEGEAELVNSTNAQGYSDYMHRLSTSNSTVGDMNSAGSVTPNTTGMHHHHHHGSINVTPLRTGKRGRPPGSTTGSAAKRMAQQAEQVVLLSRAVIESQKQLRELREALATVVETQSNQSAVLAVLQQQLGKSGNISNKHQYQQQQQRSAQKEDEDLQFEKDDDVATHATMDEADYSKMLA